jgi:tRNA-dihydrouridine synthase
MLGRGALGNPWIYREIEAALDGLPAPERPSVAERKRVLLRHVDLQERYEERPAGHLRRVICWYFKDVPGVAAFRDRIHRCQAPAEMRAVIEEFTSPAE